MTRHIQIQRAATLVVIAVITASTLGSCSSEDDSSPASTTNATSTVPAMTSSPATSTPDEPAEVVERTIVVQDPDLGTLTFDAIAAGDPDAAAEGKLVLLLHGFPESNEAYREFLEPLAAAGYYAVAPNQRGYSAGARPEAVADYEILELVDDVDAMATELGASRFHLVGHDWGGGVAWVSALMRPERLASMTVLSTPHPDAMLDGYEDPGGDQRRRSEYVGWFTSPDFVTDVLADGRESFEAIFGAGGGIPDAHVRHYSEVLGTPEALSAALNYYLATPFFQNPRVGPVSVPTLYVFGSEDSAFSAVSAESTEAYVDADYRYEVIAGASHWLPETHARDIVPMVLEHMATHG